MWRAAVDIQSRCKHYQKDDGIMATRGKKKVSKTSEAALVGDFPWMLSGKCLEEGLKGTGSGKHLVWLFSSCSAGLRFPAFPDVGAHQLCFSFPVSDALLQVWHCSPSRSPGRCHGDTALCRGWAPAVPAAAHGSSLCITWALQNLSLLHVVFNV